MNKTVRILHFSPHNQEDGIAKYQEQYLSALKNQPGVANNFFATTPLDMRNMDPQQKTRMLEKLAAELENYDILHIQHEFGLFSEDDFQRLFQAAKDAGKKVVITVHLSPDYAITPVKLGGLGPRSWIRYLKQKRHYNRMVARHVTPFVEADCLIVHNDIAASALRQFGADKSKIIKIPHPVYTFATPEKSDLIAKKLNRQKGDVIFCTIGMMHRYKGIFDAIRALKFLPTNYKLAIIGGVHPISEDVFIYNVACNLIDMLGLKDRVYITGYIHDDNKMNSLIRECDVSLFPYDGQYYAHTSSGAINLALANEQPVIAYPTKGFVELARQSAGAIVLCDTFAYYELARNLQTIDLKKQAKLSADFAKANAWPKAAKILAQEYRKL